MITFVIPMAGEGRRFREAGYLLPKMLIETKGKTLLEWSVGSLPLNLCSKLIFIGLTKHEVDFNLTKKIKNIYKDYNLKIECIFLERGTRGQSETVLTAKRIIPPEKPLLIFNIDTYFSSSSLETALNQEENGILGAFKNKNPQFSFAKTSIDGLVTEVAEKNPISSNALTGLYHFQKGKHFIKAAEEAINKVELVKGEFYIAPLYNKLINRGLNFRINICDDISILGTPEELNTFENR